jgi:hypothetical protein
MSQTRSKPSPPIFTDAEIRGWVVDAGAEQGESRKGQLLGFKNVIVLMGRKGVVPWESDIPVAS